AGDFLEYFARRRVDQTLDEVEAHTANSRGIERAQLRVRYAARHGCDAPRPAGRCAQRIEQRPVIGAVARCLDDDVTLESEKIAQRPEMLLRGVAGGVFALRRVRKLLTGAEHMAMRIDRAGRGRVGGL